MKRQIFPTTVRDFFLKKTCQEPFVFQDKVYRMNYKVHVFEQLEKPVPEFYRHVQRWGFNRFPNAGDKVGVGVVQRVFDEPLIDSPDMDQEMRTFMTDLNGRDFHKQYFELMIKPMLKEFVSMHGLRLEDLPWEKTLSAVCINYVMRQVVSGNLEDELNFDEQLDATIEWVLPNYEIPETEDDFALFLIWIKA